MSHTSGGGDGDGEANGADNHDVEDFEHTSVRSDASNYNVVDMEVNELSNKRKGVENSPENDWQSVNRHRKVRRYGQQTDVGVSSMVSVMCSKPLPKQFELARLFKDNNVKGVSRVKYSHQHKILITFDSELNADFFVQCKTFCDLNWQCQKTSEVGMSYGVINNIEIDLTDKYILESLRCDGDVKLVSARRLNKRASDDDQSTSGWVKSESVRLGFEGSFLPSYVYIDYMRLKVERFIFPVTQCSRCWKFGHARLVCPSKKTVCPKCTKNHDNCETSSFRCVNCTGNHLALQKICPVYKKERKIRELMAEFNCTYRRALTLYVPPSPVPARDVSPAPVFNSANKTPISKPVESSNPAEPTINNLSTKSNPLWSQLFTSSSNDQKTPAKSKKRKSREVPRPRSSAQSVPDFDWYDDAAHSEVVDKEIHTGDISDTVKEKREARSKDLGFVRLLIRLKNIVFSEVCLEVKIQQAVSICAEWLVSKVVSSFSIDSLLNKFINGE